MRIGELAERAGTTTRTLRYYESRGLLTARRTGNGYRAYGEEDLRLVRQIRLLQDFGFELEDTRPFVECLQAGHQAGMPARPHWRCTGASWPSWTTAWPGSARCVPRWRGNWPAPSWRWRARMPSPGANCRRSRPERASR